MKLIEIKTLTPCYENAIWNLLVLADKEFIPALSARNSTQQTSFQEADPMEQDKPYMYFETIKHQSFILGLENDRVVAFLSYIPDYVLPFLHNETEITSNYVSTIIVHPKFRGQKITQTLYSALMKKGKYIATRTWSSNIAHIKILQELGFEQILTLPNDRGQGIDTLYFLKK